MCGVYRKITASVIQSDAEMEFDGSLVELQKLERVPAVRAFFYSTTNPRKAAQGGRFPGFYHSGFRVPGSAPPGEWVVVYHSPDFKIHKSVTPQKFKIPIS